MSVPWLIGGLVVVESAFVFPGLGRLLVFAIQYCDIPIIESVSVLTATTICLASFHADLGLFEVSPDPRVTAPFYV